MRNNKNDKYWIVDYNGFLRATATTLVAAKKRAKQVRNEIGIAVNLTYTDRTPFGPHTHVIRYRSIVPVHFQSNGWMVKAGGLRH
jgi:hypothetical protein